MLVIILTIAFMVGSVFLALSRGMAYMPDMESNQASITFTTDEDTDFEKTAEITDTIMERLMKYEDVVDIGARIGSSSILGSMGSLGGGGTDEHAVTMYAVLKEQKSMTNDQFVKKVQEEMSDLPVELNIDMASMDLGSLMTSGIAINITGQDLDKLQMLARQCASVLENTEGCIDVDDGMDDAMPEFRITVDKTRAMAHSLTVAQVYQEIYKQIGTKGSATALKTDTGDFDIYVTDSETEELTREDIKNMVFTATNALGENVEVALKDIASFEDTQALTTIKRASQNRYLTVKAAVDEGYNVTQVATKINRELKNIVVPEGYTVEMKGEDSTIMDAAKEILKLMALAIVLMYLIMVAQFQSLKYPFIIMITIPLAFTGGFLALFIAGLEVSIVALVGFVMLAGIIVNNGIVLIDYANQLIAEGKDVRSALIEAGMTRLRPIFMTALTTILGLVTLAAGLGMGADMVQPMAVVTIGGLIYGTLLTLFAVPCMYLCMTPKKKRGEQLCPAEGVMEDADECLEEADEASEDEPSEEEPGEDSEEE
ncbi:MAG: efflux RND transporter permease subunit [Parasporobacterium sp.]|nr:efflux RND transporter permease subunit [Parasporobacterium sp.]